jgi:hypothetical protein
MTVHRHCCCSTNPCVLADLPWKCEDAAHCYGERIKPFQEGSTINLVLDIDTAAGTIPITGGGTVSREITIHIEGEFELVSGRTGCTWQSTGATATLPTGVSGGSMNVQQLDACVEIEFGAMYLAFTKITIRPTELGAVDDAIYYMPTLYVNVEACDATTPGLRFIAVGNDLNSIVPASVSHKYFWQLGGTIDGTGVSETLLGSATIATEFGPIVPIEDYSWLGLTGSAATPADDIVRSLSLRYTNWCGARTYFVRITGFRYVLDPNEWDPAEWPPGGGCEGLYGPCPSYTVVNSAIDQVSGLGNPCSSVAVWDGFQGFGCMSGITTRTYPSGTYVATVSSFAWGYQCIPFGEGPNGYSYTETAGSVRYQPGAAPFIISLPVSNVSASWTMTSTCNDCDDPCENLCETVESYPQGGAASLGVQANPAQS